MSNKADLQRKLKEIGYEVGPFASKDTLSNVIRLHSTVLQNKGIDVAKLNDLSLRKNLIESGLPVGPVTNHTRAIYQRKLLEVLTNESSEGNEEDEVEVNAPIAPPATPPRTTRSSIVRTTANDSISSAGRIFPSEKQEPRIALTRVEVDDKNKQPMSPYYSTTSNTKSKSEQTITHSYSPQRSSIKPESRPSATTSYGLRNPYDFQNDEPIIIRHEHKATPFRTSTISTNEAFSSNTNRSTKPTDVPSVLRTDLTEIRSRVLTNANETKQNETNKDSIAKANTSTNRLDNSKLPNNEETAVSAKSGGTLLYGSIAIVVALIVFVVYLWFET